MEASRSDECSKGRVCSPLLLPHIQICVGCGTICYQDEEYCSLCGDHLSATEDQSAGRRGRKGTCSACGASLRHPVAYFCGLCGAKVESIEEGS